MATNQGPSGMGKTKRFLEQTRRYYRDCCPWGLILGAGALFYKFLPQIIALASNTLYLAGMLLVLGAIIYMVLDPRMRTLIGYMYKSMMRWITGLFVTIDPIGILKNYIESLERSTLAKMSEQIGVLKGRFEN